MIDREVQDQLYDPKRKKGTWLDFVKSHKHIRKPNGQLDLKRISAMWKAYDLRISGSRKKLARLANHLRKEHPSTKGKMRLLDPPKRWLAAMAEGIRKRSDVKNPIQTAKNIWERLKPASKQDIINRAKKGETFKYNLPLPDDRETHGTGTLRMVKPFKLVEVQANINAKDFADAQRSGLFRSMKRNDGSTCQVARCKSREGNVNVFVDKV